MSASWTTTVNADWQFNENTWQGGIGESDAKQESPLISGLPDFIRDRSYDLATGKMISDPSRDQFDVEQMAYGQHHNPGAQQSYRNCAAQVGVYQFFKIVVSAAVGRSSNFEEARINIAWQSRELTIAARGSYLSSLNVSDPDAKIYFLVKGMYQLMSAQHHSAEVMKLYRACFRDNPDQLFAQTQLVRAMK